MRRINAQTAACKQKNEGRVNRKKPGHSTEAFYPVPRPNAGIYIIILSFSCRDFPQIIIFLRYHKFALRNPENE
jgi:hypothetical protein